MLLRNYRNMLEKGKLLAAYEILSQLGAGGMGEVYLALDTKLGREVAIKLLPDVLAKNPERQVRFEYEARILASINHPNIAAIYSLEEFEGQAFLVLEFVPGKTLAELIDHSPIGLKEAVPILSQIAAALENAHQKGIIHRDLKPANVKITAKGTVKVLDFGLAKMVAPDSSPQQLSQLMTFTDQTGQGMILGTIPYMSPEQTRGKPVDQQTDIWSFGCVIFETLSGHRPFHGESFSDVVAGILMKEPDWELLPRSVPPKIRDLIDRCLQKDIDKRLRDIADVRAELEGILEDPGHQILTPVSQPILSQITSTEGIHGFPAWSPTGDRLAFCADVDGFKKIIVKDLQTGIETQLTQGSTDDIQPAWEPSGKSILFVRSNQPRGKLEPGDVFGEYIGGDIWKLDLTSGKEQKFIANAFNAAYSPDGKWIAVDASWVGPRRIWIVNNQGSNPEQITTDLSEALSHVNPHWSPDGKKIVFQHIERTKFDIQLVDVASKTAEWITNDLYQDLNPVWSGEFIYFTSYRSGGLNLWRIPASSRGVPQQLTIGAGQDVQPAISPDGKQLAFTILRQNADVWRLPVAPNNGKVTGLPSAVIASSREDSRGAWSPDGLRIALNSDRTGNMNIWIYSFAEKKTQQVTNGPGGDFQPNWSLDGKRIAFFSSRSGNPEIWIVDSNGNDLKQLTESRSVDINPFFRPNGKHIAYQSDRSGRLEVWMMNVDGSNPYQITNFGVMGHFLRWSADGDFLFCRCSSGKQPLMKVPIQGGEPSPVKEIAGGSHISFSPDQSLIMDVVGHKQLWLSSLKKGKPKMVFEFAESEARIDYPVWSPDGKWILFDKFQPQGGDIWLMKGF